MSPGPTNPNRGSGDREERVRDRLAGTGMAQLRWVDETGSTNSDLIGLVDPVAPQALVADHQRAGRGRRNRTWSAPPGSGLLFSVLLAPRIDASSAHLLTQAMGIAVAGAVEAVSGVAVGLKWPNDLVVPGASPDQTDLKCAGMLAESRLAGTVVDTLVIGVGLNVNWPPSAASRREDELLATATALNLVAGHEIDREDLLVAVLTDFDRLRSLVADPEDLRGLYRERCVTIGRRVRVELEHTSYLADAIDVTTTGHLVVQTDDGDRRELAVADVVHLRPVV